MKALVGVMMVLFMLLSRPIAEAEEKGIKVAILDSGCNIPYKEGISLIDRSLKDYNSHGTLMARIIKEKAPFVELYIIKVMDRDGFCVNDEAVIRGIEWAISKEVDLINMSLGLEDSDKLQKVISKAYNKGIVIIAAAGNEGMEVAYPAKYNEVIAVGAVNKYGKVYAGSVKGKDVEVVSRGYYGRQAGTSIASAYAVGIAARIIFAQKLFLQPEALKSVILQMAKKTGGELK
ncbi:MAG: S8 family serine peptidase [Candidatus Omnitrophota bacterium]